MARKNLFADVTTSFIDLAFNLLLFFVISLVIVPENVVPIRLPRTSTSSEETTLQVADDLIFYVMRDGRVLVEDQLLADSTAVDSLLFARADTVIAQYRLAKPEGRLILKADSGAVWDRPVQVMQAAGKHGLPLSIALEPQLGR